MFENKSVAYYTLGCRLNFAESSTLAARLEQLGFKRVKSGAPEGGADLLVVNTCAVTEQATAKCRQQIRKLIRENPRAFVLVTGCYAQIEPKELADSIGGIDLIVGSEFKGENLTALLGDLTKRAEAEVVTTRFQEIHTFHASCSADDRTRHFLKVQDGCNYFCSYCTIPLARGKSRNPSIATIVEQAREAIDGGAKEIILSGVNIGDFGRSTGERFIDLLRALDRIQDSGVGSQESGFRIRISSCEPNLLTDEIIDFVATSKHFAPHFHIPLQSGSNEVLKIMGRRYTRELFAERVHHIKTVMPHAFIGVDCMVGVRGETAESW